MNVKSRKQWDRAHSKVKYKTDRKIKPSISMSSFILFRNNDAHVCHDHMCMCKLIACISFHFTWMSLEWIYHIHNIEMCGRESVLCVVSHTYTASIYETFQCVWQSMILIFITLFLCGKRLQTKLSFTYSFCSPSMLRHSIVVCSLNVLLQIDKLTITSIPWLKMTTFCPIYGGTLCVRETENEITE